MADIANANARLKMQQLENKISDERNKANGAVSQPGASQGSAAAGGLPPLPAATAPTAHVDDDIEVSGIYGLGNDLSAEVIFNGNYVPISRRSSMAVGDWTVTEITPVKVSFTKKVKVGKGKGAHYAVTTKEVFLSAGTIGSSADAQKFASPAQNGLGSFLGIPGVSGMSGGGLPGAGGTTGGNALPPQIPEARAITSVSSLPADAPPKH
ncbi:hypothetical protein F6X40_10735 [Paraburkholderia sp. UCT31]|uniref:hypothetical protein n=1 Tax=Paraburkholderia sp. UCT31 TaxID=2615209 RepID=UPI00165674FA|nr:hypothetical protein [Paraburkholderia sp. UCT31]MBC8737284.1 hypothetical protein [Paraburkholderia sp. UCT31]